MAGLPPTNLPHIAAQPMMQMPQHGMPQFPMGMRAPLMPVPHHMMMQRASKSPDHEHFVPCASVHSLVTI